MAVCHATKENSTSNSGGLEVGHETEEERVPWLVVEAGVGVLARTEG